MKKEILNDVEAADFLGLSAANLRRGRWKKTGPPFVRLGRRIVYKISDLQEYLDRHRVDPEAQREAG